MNRRDHHCSPIAPRLLLALIPPSTRIGLAGGHSSQLMLCSPARLRAPAVGVFPPRSSQAPHSSVQPPTRPSARGEALGAPFPRASHLLSLARRPRRGADPGA